MSHRLIFASVLLLVSALACADFDSAAQAYRNKHYADAYRQFLVLARSGDARAQTVIAMMTKYGESVAQDPAKAFSWYMKAANQGYGPALYNVGVMYAEGNGVKQDRNAAIEWLHKAAKAGFKRADQKLEELGEPVVRHEAKADGSPRWRESWDFRLPNRIRDDSVQQTRVAPDSTYRVQLGTMATRAAANRLWDALTRQVPALFADVDPIINLADNSTHRLYRVQTGPFDSLKSARNFCRQLQRQVQTGCLPVRQ